MNKRERLSDLHIRNLVKAEISKKRVEDRGVEMLNSADLTVVETDGVITIEDLTSDFCDENLERMPEDIAERFRNKHKNRIVYKTNPDDYEFWTSVLDGVVPREGIQLVTIDNETVAIPKYGGGLTQEIPIQSAKEFFIDICKNFGFSRVICPDELEDDSVVYSYYSTHLLKMANESYVPETASIRISHDFTDKKTGEAFYKLEFGTSK